ncbi:MAG: response regulator [Gemmatirosa sp.]
MTAMGAGPVGAAATGATPGSGGRRGVVLLVEDSAADADLTREALAGSPLIVELHVVTDGREALAFLRRAGPHAQAPVPDLVMLDLNMPGMDGRTLLAELKQDPALRHIPVVILSSSAAPGDVAAAYGLSANCYVTKPVGLDSYLSTVRSIEQFWLGVSTPPPHAP